MRLETKTFFDSSGSLLSAEAAVIDSDVVLKGNFTFVADEAICFTVTQDTLCGSLDVALGSFVFQTILCHIALQTDLLGSDQLCVVELRIIRTKDFFDALHIVPVMRIIEGPHEGKDHAIVVAFGKFLEEDPAAAINNGTIQRTEYFQYRFNGDMVVKQAKVSDLAKLLPDSHFTDGGFTKEKKQFHGRSPYFTALFLIHFFIWEEVTSVERYTVIESSAKATFSSLSSSQM